MSAIAKYSGVSRKDVSKTCEQGIIKPCFTDEKGRKYFTVNDILRLIIFRRSKSLGICSEDTALVLKGESMSKILIKNFGHILYWLKILDTDINPFSFYTIGKVVEYEYRSLMYRKIDCGKITGWDEINRAIHEAILDTVSLGYTIDDDIAAHATFCEDGTPVIDNISIPVVSENRKECIGLEEFPAGRWFNAAWYGPTDLVAAEDNTNRYEILKDKGICDGMKKGPAVLVDYFEAEARLRGFKPIEDVYLVFTEDFYSIPDFDPAHFYCYLSAMIS